MTTTHEFHAITTPDDKLAALLVLKLTPKTVTAKITIGLKSVSSRSGGTGYNRYRAAIAGAAFNFLDDISKDPSKPADSDQQFLLELLSIEGRDQLQSLQTHGYGVVSST